MTRPRVFAALVCGAVLYAQPASASFHLMQIEQVIGGVNGDTTRQAIMLRMRANGQNQVQSARLQAWDAAGANPVLVVDMGVFVPNSMAGDHVLIASANFLPGLTPDFVMTNPIPASYLAAGKLTFEQDNGTVYWGLAWGGAAYTGTNTGVTVGAGGNDPDGDFNPPFAGPMPSSNTQAVRFTGAASALSSNNAADYALSAGAALFANNSGSSGTVPVELLGFSLQ